MGFFAETDFTRAFKRHYGISPKMARARPMTSYADAKDDAAMFEYEIRVRNLAR